MNYTAENTYSTLVKNTNPLSSKMQTTIWVQIQTYHTRAENTKYTLAQHTNHELHFDRREQLQVAENGNLYIYKIRLISTWYS